MFSINIYSNTLSDSFQSISNLFHPSTIDQSFQNDGQGIAYGIKNDQDEWNLKGHSNRIISITQRELAIFAQVYDETNSPALQARLPFIHVRQILEVLKKFAMQPRRLGDIKANYFASFMFHETYAQQDGTIHRETRFPDSIEQLILSGPHFYAAKPFHQTPKAVCETHRAYDNIDLIEITNDYLPRTNYLPACDENTYRDRCDKVPWSIENDDKKVYRLCCRRRFGISGERSLISAIFPSEVCHINSIISIIFKSKKHLSNFSALFCSIIFDFFLRLTGRADLYESTISQFPFIENQIISLRALMLNCITDHYAELWEECWDEANRQERWTKDDPRLDNGKFTNLTPKWQRNCALRTDYERRQALVEIDVLVSMALGLTLDELCTIYRIQFPVLRQNENDTWYEQNGRIVFTCSKGLPGVGFSRPEWNDIMDMKSGTVTRTITDDTIPGGPRERTITYTAPFDRCDREADYATAWAAFEKRGLK